MPNLDAFKIAMALVLLALLLAFNFYMVTQWVPDVAASGSAVRAVIEAADGAVEVWEGVESEADVEVIGADSVGSTATEVVLTMLSGLAIIALARSVNS